MTSSNLSQKKVAKNRLHGQICVKFSSLSLSVPLQCLWCEKNPTRTYVTYIFSPLDFESDVSSSEISTSCPWQGPAGDFRSWEQKAANKFAIFTLHHLLPPTDSDSHLPKKNNAWLCWPQFSPLFWWHFSYTFFGLKWRGRSLWHLLASLSHVETPQITRCKRYRSTHVRSLAQTLVLHRHLQFE